MKTCYFDSEGLGLYSPSVIFQMRFDYSNDRHDDQPFIYDLWRNPVCQTIDLIDEIVSCRVVCHNIAFDWVRVSEFYNAARGLQDALGPTARPIDHVDQFAELVFTCRSNYCLKPAAAVCTLLLCQKQIGGAALATKEIRIRKTPVEAAPFLANILNQNTDLPAILFAKRRSDDRWAVLASDAGDEWRDVALKFAPSAALKDVARLVLGVDDTQKIGQDFQPPEFPYELGYAPYANLLNTGGWVCPVKNKDSGQYQMRKLWPLLVQEHLQFWTTPNSLQSKYALDDVILLEQLDKHLGCVDTDFDSELACQVASVRAAGLPIDTEALKRQVAKSSAAVEDAAVNVNSHLAVRSFIGEALDPVEALVVADGCDKAKLKSICQQFVLDEEEDCCDGDESCLRCGGTGVVGPGPMPVVDRARHVLDVRKHKKRLQLYDKLSISGAAFPSFRVIGTKSGRMSGADGLNYHGIDGSRDIREIFTFAEPGWVVSGGDYDSQELAIAAAVMNDAALEKDIETGKSLHGVFAAEASGIPYDRVMRFKEDKSTPEANWYKKAKICVYAILYGAASFNIANVLNITPEEAEAVIQKFFAKYPYMAQTRKLVKQSLEALRSDDEGRMVLSQPKQTYIDSVFGFRRSFDVEYGVMGVLFNAMKQWTAESRSKASSLSGLDLNRKIIRKDKKGPQTLSSCVSSALYGSVFSLQGKVLRAALNHLIQSAGRTCTLRVQKRIWDECQPAGVHPFRVKLLSVHDEIIVSSPPEVVSSIQKAARESVEDLCKTVPLLTIGWATDVGSWYGVKAAVAPGEVGDVTAKEMDRYGWRMR